MRYINNTSMENDVAILKGLLKRKKRWKTWVVIYIAVNTGIPISTRFYEIMHPFFMIQSRNVLYDIQQIVVFVHRQCLKKRFLGSHRLSTISSTVYEFCPLSITEGHRKWWFIISIPQQSAKFNLPATGAAIREYKYTTCCGKRGKTRSSIVIWSYMSSVSYLCYTFLLCCLSL